MEKCSFLFLLLMFGLVIFAQKENTFLTIHSDFEYSLRSNGLMTKTGSTNNLFLPATKTDSLYRGKDYNQYKAINEQANIQRKAGLFITLAGIAQVIPGAYMTTYQANRNSDIPYNAIIGVLLITSGASAFIVGISMGTVGQVKWKKSKNAMEHIKGGLELSLVVRPGCVGLVIHL